VRSIADVPADETPDETPIELAKNRAWPLLERWNRALETGEIDEARWYPELTAVIVPAYLASDNSRAQSGSDGTIEDWPHKHGLLADACDRDGAFLDVGCASGYLAALGPVPRRCYSMPTVAFRE